jgi:predicted Holliday junction resolvase-like endonuclease
MLKVLFELFLLYMLYKLIFDFIIPIYNTTKQVKQKVNEMQRNVNEQMNRQERNEFNATAKEPAPKTKGDDYIEFEEVK